MGNGPLNGLFAASWPGYAASDFEPIHRRSLGYICAFDGDRLIGYVNVAGDGGVHAFLLDPTVHPDYRLHGIGTELVKSAVQLAREKGATWLHVDFEPHLEKFYRESCGFTPTLAGVMRLD